MQNCSLVPLTEEEAGGWLLWLVSTIWVGFPKTLQEQDNSPTMCFITQFHDVYLIFALCKISVYNSSELFLVSIQNIL